MLRNSGFHGDSEEHKSCGRVSRESGGISREEQRQWLADNSVVDIPRLFDVAVLFGPANRELVTELMRQVCFQHPHALIKLYIKEWT